MKTVLYFQQFGTVLSKKEARKITGGNKTPETTYDKVPEGCMEVRNVYLSKDGCYHDGCVHNNKFYDFGIGAGGCLA